jgi:hypothetical protein
MMYQPIDRDQDIVGTSETLSDTITSKQHTLRYKMAIYTNAASLPGTLHMQGAHKLPLHFHESVRGLTRIVFAALVVPTPWRLQLTQCLVSIARGFCHQKVSA